MNRNEEVVELMRELKQDHILEKYDIIPNEEREVFNNQILHQEKIYPGGIREYIKRAKILLEDSKNNVNPYANFTPSIPEGVNITVGDDKFFELESVGIKELLSTGFVLVAGGLGERLGYNDIKIGIPIELVTKRLFIQVYIENLLAYEARMRKIFDVGDDWCIPLCIMTSDDTHSKTVKLLQDYSNFGMKPDQIEIVKQEKCPALLDNDCHLALMQDKFLLETKPHGHGDVHTLLLQYGVVERWLSKGKKWIIFFQDTNALVFNVVPTALGVSMTNSLVVNSIAMPRKPGEAVGGICKLTDKEGKQITINVEYNQLDSLLRDKYNPSGDVPNENGLSDFPGNTNVLVFEITSYFNTLQRTKGLIPEFVNPKYADAQKTIFKSPTRLECMMQEYPKLLEANEKVGFTMYERWFSFSTCKNNLKDGTDKLKKNLIPETAFSVEQDIFKCNEIILKEYLQKLEIINQSEDVEPVVDIMGVKIKLGPRIIIYPSFAICVSELRDKVNGKIQITENSSLILQGMETVIKNVTINGVCSISESSSEDIICDNKIRHVYIPLKEGEGEHYEVIRGYHMEIQQ